MKETLLPLIVGLILAGFIIFSKTRIDPVNNCEYNADWSSTSVREACAGPEQ